VIECIFTFVMSNVSNFTARW